jgi:hypothetical protein
MKLFLKILLGIVLIVSVGEVKSGNGNSFDIYGYGTGQLRQRPVPTIQYYPMHR